MLSPGVMRPTDEQRQVIHEPSHCAIVAKPGSGKTFTLAHKVRTILPLLPPHKGIAAISFTNKASDELRRRATLGGLDTKASFFGTIDKFLLGEILLPFGRHVMGDPTRPLEVVQDTDLPEPLQAEFTSSTRPGVSARELKDLLVKFYRDGWIVLSMVGRLACYVLSASRACKRYLAARYSHVLIDEYQDCDIAQHTIFLKLVELGVIGVAVGDADQSIFKFAGKDSKYLLELAGNPQFRSYALTRNYRSHPSIVRYATRLIAATYTSPPPAELRVWHKHNLGSESDIANWIGSAICVAEVNLGISRRSEVAVLARSQRTLQLISSSIGIPHKVVAETTLDQVPAVWAKLYRDLLFWLLSARENKYDLLARYFDIDLKPKEVRAALELLRTLESIGKDDVRELRKHIDKFESLAKLAAPNSSHAASTAALSSVLSDERSLLSYVPADDSEVTMMTLHKSKGLEFDLVFHLDLHQYILPMYNGDRLQDLNLHYVGITRARHGVVLCTSTTRHNSSGSLVSASQSEFLSTNGLPAYRCSWPY